MTVFGQMPDGRPVHQVRIGTGPLRATVLTLGACLQDVRLAGVAHSLTLGFPSLCPYLDPYYHVGTIMGPVANRISDARAWIGGKEHRFERNFLGAHTLHGGSAATHAKVWEIASYGQDHVVLRVALPDGEGGFPGNREITARFDVDGAALTLALDAATDAPTLMNLANHSYWCLGPALGTGGHRLEVAADHYLSGDPRTTIPTGEIAAVTGTRFDYRAGRTLQAGAEGLLDFNHCLARARRALQPVARLTGPTGISMAMATTEPGLQVFDGHVLGNVKAVTTDGRTTKAYAALALEAQFWPDAPNQPDFPDITLRPGAPWRQITRWSFSSSSASS